MLKRILILAFAAAAVTSGRGQSAIAYFNGPEFVVPARFSSHELDLDADGQPDYRFWGEEGECTADVPISACYSPFYVGGTAPNEILVSVSAHVLPFGEWIGSNAPSGAAWRNVAPGVLLTADYSSERFQEAYWLGPLGARGIGYLGVRFHAADGLHYGWIRVRLARTDGLHEGNVFESSPRVMEWAYETRPNTPIRAGATGLENETTEFKVDFRNASGTPHGNGEYTSTGRVRLVANCIRYELHVAGTDASAAIRGPAVPHSNSKPALNLSRPRIDIHIGCRQFYDPSTGLTVQRCGPDYAVFFGEVTLSHSQVIQLRRGAYYVSVDNGAVLGAIVPAEAAVQRKPR